MDRRKVLLIVAAVVAALGTLLVFLYVRSADNRADQRYKAVQVLTVVKQIEPGETVAAAEAAGKIEVGTVGEGQRLPDALSSTAGITGQVSLTRLYPGEQIIQSKFGATAAGVVLSVPKDKIAISITLSDTARVAGFINPGDDVVIFHNGAGYSRILLPTAKVIAIGSTTVISTTTTDATGASTTEQFPRTLLTLALSQPDAERIMVAEKTGALQFGLADKATKVAKDAGITSAQLFN